MESNNFDQLLEVARILSDPELATNETAVLAPVENRTIDFWTDGQSRWLLDNYGKYMARIGPCRKFRNKKAMWAHLAEKINAELGINKTADQLCNRYKTIMRKRKLQMDNNNKSGNTRVSVEFEEETTKIMARDDSIQPEVLRGVGFVKKKTPEEQSETTTKEYMTQKKKKRKIHPGRSKRNAFGVG